LLLFLFVLCCCCFEGVKSSVLNASTATSHTRHNPGTFQIPVPFSTRTENSLVAVCQRRPPSRANNKHET
jgi:hypothetical protein